LIPVSRLPLFFFEKYFLSETPKAINRQPQPQKFNQPFLPILVEVSVLDKKVNQEIENEDAESDKKN
jgi:hypothetical protein